MMNYIKHLSQIKIISLMFFAVIFLFGCGEEHKKTDYVARVNDSYLSKEKFLSMIDTNSSSNFYRNEAIRKWINREVLYQEAVKKGILEKEEYNSLITKTKRELAVTFMLNQYALNEKINVNPVDLISFYEENQKDFRLSNETYYLNMIQFGNENRAVEFRSVLLNSDWQNSVDIFSEDTTIISSKSKVLLKEQDIFPAKVLRVVKRLHPLEISIVIYEKRGYYSIVQVLGKYSKGSLPPFDVIKENIIKRYLEEKRKEIIEDYINDLYSKNDIELIN
ncbi:MAG: peptidyl-prolyl cis-trans isomerase [Ignavibacteria bacterium]|nr:MAG: peptidyl-prolyl cis-trans isomerase [Ignavibacteria bacterium]